jgi:recombination protein RecR
MLQIPALEKLVHELSKLPGIGPKTAQRLAYYILKNRDQYPDKLKEGLIRVQSEIHDCPQCFNFTDSDICRYCSDTNRRNELLCVVEEPSDIDRIESSRAFQGRYHVLHGALSPLEGIGPEKLKLQELVQRIEDSEIKEVILALDSDLEGDTTVLYISRLLQGKGVRMSRIAQGIPIGSDIDYVDDRTMGRALQNRVEI